MTEVKPAKDPVWKPPDIMRFIKGLYRPTDRNRMYARLMTHMSVDVWMTYELMEVAIKKIVNDNTFPGEFKLLETIRDTTSSEVAQQLDLIGKAADNFCSFQGIKINSDTKQLLRHINRPDGTFIFDLTKKGSSQKMVLFYEGDDHTKDANKTLIASCKNSHKMYQYFAQSQSYNPDMAGCAIFANIFYGYPDVKSFLDSMYKAHMFAFAAIAHYNFEEDRKKTTLHSLLDLKDDVVYDFVIGINMDLKESTKFTDSFFNARTEIIQSIIKNVDITIPEEMKENAEITKTTFTIDNVKIAILGIPRLKDLDWNAGPQQGCFVYPNDIAKKVIFNDKRFGASTDIFRKLVEVKMNSNYMNVNFRTGMSDVKTLLVEHNKKKSSSNSRKYCQLVDTNGFFLIALPLAYYTISQFECVNNLLKYRYSSSQKKFKPFLLKFKDALLHHKTTQGRVDMFERKQTSLFCEICESVQRTPDIDEDFKTFLNEVCRWRATDESSNPAIFFRSMRILSLQNAIDFAFEFSNQQNPTYTKMLSSYPIGTQILLKQCLQQLNESGIAYLSREQDNVSDGSSGTDDDEDDDDDDDEGIISKIQQFVEDQTKATFWNVELDSQASSENSGVLGQAVCKKLLEVYKAQIKWEVYWGDVESENIEDLPDPEKMEDVTNVFTPFKMSWIDIQDPRKKYKFSDSTDKPLILKPIINQEFNCNEEDIFNAVQKREEVEVIMKWGGSFIKFTMVFSDRKKMLMNGIEGAASWFSRLFRY